VAVVVVKSSTVVSDAADAAPMTVAGKQTQQRLALAGLAKKGFLVLAVREGAAKGEKRGIGRSGHVVTSLGDGHAILCCTRRSSQTMRSWVLLPVMARGRGVEFGVKSVSAGDLGY